jgi:hypothetical protein
MYSLNNQLVRIDGMNLIHAHGLIELPWVDAQLVWSLHYRAIWQAKSSRVLWYNNDWIWLTTFVLKDESLTDVAITDTRLFCLTDGQPVAYALQETQATCLSVWGSPADTMTALAATTTGFIALSQTRLFVFVERESCYMILKTYLIPELHLSACRTMASSENLCVTWPQSEKRADINVVFTKTSCQVLVNQPPWQVFYCHKKGFKVIYDKQVSFINQTYSTVAMCADGIWLSHSFYPVGYIGLQPTITALIFFAQLPVEVICSIKLFTCLSPALL